MKSLHLILAAIALALPAAAQTRSAGTQGQGIQAADRSPFLNALGGTTAGKALFQLPNPGAVRFLRLNADNSVTALDAAGMLSAIGGGAGGSSAWGGITGTLADQTDLAAALSGKQATITDGSLTIARTSGLQAALDAKQTALVSGTTIKTINGTSLLGSGNIVISSSGGTWGSITGTLSAQTDLAAALALKAPLASPTFTGTVTAAAMTSTSLTTPSVLLSEAAAPATPASGKVIFYAKGDGLIYGKDDAGIETALSNGSGGMSATDIDTSAELRGILTDERGTGAALFAGGETDTLIIAISDETTALTTGTAKVTLRAPYAMTITGVKASLTTVSSSGLPTFDVNETGVSILSTKLSVDASEKTSTTAATAAVISDSAIAADAEITIDIDVAGTGATGAKIYITHLH